MTSSPYINHFIQPDGIIPNPSDPQSWNRYSYVQNNPVRYIDPSGHNGCSPTDVNCVKQDLGIIFAPGFTDAQKTLIVETAYKFADAMGGTDNFRNEFGEIKFTPINMETDGFQETNKNTKGYFYPGHPSIVPKGIYMNQNGGYGEWTITHELGHQWDHENDDDLSLGLESFTGGGTNSAWSAQLKSYGACAAKPSRSGCNKDGYFFMGTLINGSDGNFNRKEDFAESAAAYVLGRSRNLAPKRWDYIDQLMKDVQK